MELLLPERLLIAWPVEIDGVIRVEDRMIPSQATFTYCRKLLKAITAGHLLFLQKDTFRARSIAFRTDSVAIRSPRADEEQRCQ